MEGLSPLQIVGASAVALVVVSWLAASFLAPGAGRNRAAWLGAFGIYLALSSLFVSLLMGAESLAGRIGFGTLAVLFCSGTLVSGVRMLASLAGGGASGAAASATH